MGGCRGRGPCQNQGCEQRRIEGSTEGWKDQSTQGKSRNSKASNHSGFHRDVESGLNANLRVADAVLAMEFVSLPLAPDKKDRVRLGPKHNVRFRDCCESVFSILNFKSSSRCLCHSTMSRQR